MPASSRLPVGTTINQRYRVEAFLGDGAAGEVYRVADDNLQVEVALKLLKPVAGQPAGWEEARALEELRGDYLLPVYNADVVHNTDLRLVTTRLMTGGDLETRAKDTGVTADLAAKWTAQLAHASERLHVAGMLHRDIKPGNAFLDDEQAAFLGDLGMAAKIDPDGRAVANGTLVTVAPEVMSLSDPHCTVASDIYSLGATAFYLACGRYPIDDRLPRAEIRDRLLDGNRRKLRDMAPHVSPAMAAAIDRAMSQSPSDRHESALDFANQIATAKRPPRPWRTVQHPNHVACMHADDELHRKGVTVCAIPSGNKCDIQVTQTSGRVQRRHCKTDIRAQDIAKELRALSTTV